MKRPTSSHPAAPKKAPMAAVMTASMFTAPSYAGGLLRCGRHDVPEIERELEDVGRIVERQPVRAGLAVSELAKLGEAPDVRAQSLVEQRGVSNGNCRVRHAVQDVHGDVHTRRIGRRRYTRELCEQLWAERLNGAL